MSAGTSYTVQPRDVTTGAKGPEFGINSGRRTSRNPEFCKMLSPELVSLSTRTLYLEENFTK
jgi:hypothetical protein